VAFVRETPSLQNERAMVRSILLRDGWRAGFVPTDADLGAVTAPFRMVFGSADPTGSVDLWRHFTSRLAQGELQIVEGAGHMPWWDEPAVVGRSVREFLAGSAG
jgi:pimeloyl-ACP methyl ester carboxylesterase